MADIHPFPSLARPRPLLVHTHDRARDCLTVWEQGPVDPDATRSQARDLTALIEGHKLWSAAVAAEASRLAMLTDPEVRAKHEFSLAEALRHAREHLDAIERTARLSDQPDTPGAA